MRKDMNSSREFAGETLNSEDEFNGASPINITFVFSYDFERNGPPIATKAHQTANRTLDYNYYDDCKTGEELKEFAKTWCDENDNDEHFKEINIIQAYNPKLVLGQSEWIDFIWRKEIEAENEMHDLKLLYRCEAGMMVWQVSSRQEPTVIT